MFSIMIALLSGALALETCHIANFEGGGVHGAFEAGTLKAMVEQLDSKDIQWDVVAGISTGSINASMVARFAPGEEDNMLNAVLDLWYGIKGNSDVYDPWSRFEWFTIYFKPSRFDTTALKETLQKNYKRRPIKRRVNIGATNFNTGQWTNFNETLPIDTYLKAIMASSAWPPLFPNIEIDGEYYADGGVLYLIDIATPINRCLDLVGGDQTKVTVDFLLDGKVTDYDVSNVDWDNLTTDDVNNIVNNIKKFDSQPWNFELVRKFFPDINMRYVIYPDRVLPWAFNFSPEEIAFEIDLGYQIATETIKNGVMYEHIEHHFAARKHIDHIKPRLAS